MTVSIADRLKTWLKSPAFIYVAGACVARLGSFLLVPLYAKMLTPAEYGDLILAQTVVALLSVLGPLALATALPKAYFDAPTPREGERAVGALATWIVLFALLVAALLGLLARVLPWKSNAFGAWETTCVLCAFVGTALTAIPSAVLRAGREAKRAVAFQLAEFFSVTASGLLLVQVFHRGFRGAIEAYALGYVFSGALALAFIFVRLQPRFDRALLAKYIGPSVRYMPHVLGSWILSVSDRWILKALGMHAEVGLYGLAFFLVSPAVLVTTSYNEAAAARFSEHYREGGLRAMQAVRREVERGYLAAGALPALGMLAMLPLLPYVVGPRYDHASAIVPGLLVCCVIDTQYYASSTILYCDGKTHWISAVTFLACALGAVLTALGARTLGVTGVVIARGVNAAFRAAALWILAEISVRRSRATFPA